MSLLIVPTEILDEVVMLVFQAVGLDEAAKLRLICRKADHPPFQIQPNTDRAVQRSCPAIHISST